MTEQGPNFSRSGRNKSRKRSSVILNSLIGVVVLLIIIVAATIVLGNDDDGKAGDENLPLTGDTAAEEKQAEDDPQDNEDVTTNDAESDSTDEEESGQPEGSNTLPETGSVKEDGSVEGDDQSSGSVTSVISDDAIIAETIVDASWQPVGTTQTGDHVSQYNSDSVDWNEKQQALAYATGLSQDSMIFWKIKNNGGPQKSVGIVSSKDKEEKYRVYLEWVDGEGWKPVQMDVLKTLDFAY
ncbi:DUF1510 family protein [Sporosarcina sp. NPDC096371]|uniref:YrrS family protein n=1 Tax=Sporosarcina sp. NPDC096371 TaxID=3364530 RepID=UPI0037F48B53